MHRLLIALATLALFAAPVAAQEAPVRPQDFAQKRQATMPASLRIASPKPIVPIARACGAQHTCQDDSDCKYNAPGCQTCWAGTCGSDN